MRKPKNENLINVLIIEFGTKQSYISLFKISIFSSVPFFFLLASMEITRKPSL